MFTPMMRRASLFVGAVLLLVCAMFAAPAATLTVNNTGDGNDNTWGNGTDTLREAIAHATAGDTINFSITGTITLGSPLVINKNLTITGPGAASLTISGNNAYRVFFLDSATITISGLTIANGRVTGGNGTNGYTTSSDAGAGGGGGGGGGLGGGMLLCPTTHVTLLNVTFTGCQAVGGNGGTGAASNASSSNGGNGGNGTGYMGANDASDGSGWIGEPLYWGRAGSKGLYYGGGGGGSGGSAGGAAPGGTGGIGGGGGGAASPYAQGTSNIAGGSGGLFGGNGGAGIYQANNPWGKTSAGGGGGGGGLGGAVFVHANAYLTIKGCTFTSNSTTAGSGAGSNGGGGTGSAGQSKAGAIFAHTNTLVTSYGNTFTSNVANNDAGTTYAGDGTTLNDSDHVYGYFVAKPTVINVTASNADGTFHAGDVITIQVQFSDPVTVSGIPQLKLNVGARIINYTGGSGSDTLSFTYTVVSGDYISDLDYYDTAALTLNGGSIYYTYNASNYDAKLTLPTLGGTGSLGVNKNLAISAGTSTIVTNANDAGAGSLRQVILEAAGGGHGQLHRRHDRADDQPRHLHRHR